MSKRKSRPAAAAPSAKRRWEWPVLVGILLIGGLLRGAYLRELLDAPDFACPGVDAAFHDYWARGIATGNWTPPADADDPMIRSLPYLRPPGYPYFLAALYALTGSSPLVVRIVQMTLGLVSCVLGFLLGRRLFGRGVGLLTALGMSCYWALIYFEGELLAPALIVPLALGLLYVLVTWADRLDIWRGLAAGVLLGALAVVRPNALILLPFVLVWGWWVTRRSLSRRRFPAAVVAFVLATAAVIAPVTVRNSRVSDDFVLISCNGEINLYIGNNELSDGYTPIIPGLKQMTGSQDWDWFRYPRIIGGVERQEGRLMSAGEVSECFAQRALRYMRQEPLRVLGLMGKRALLFWGPAEISSNKVVHYERQHSPTLRCLPSFPLVLAIALMGVLLFGIESTTMPPDNKSRREARARNAGAVVVLLFMVVYFASFVPFLVSARLRVPIVPFVILFAAYGLVQLGRLVAAGQIRGAVVWAVVCVGLYVLVSRPWIAYQPDLAKWHYDRGVAYASGRRFDRAAEEYRQALQVKPGSARAYNNLGNALFAQGKLDEAIAEYQAALQLDPDFAEGHYNLGNALRRQGRDESAVECYQAALRLQPDYADAHNNLANALVALGHVEQAIEHYDEALRLRPNMAEAHHNLANALLSLGRVDQAIEHYRQALRLRPEYADAHYALGHALQRQGRLAEAAEHYREALRIDPQHERARRALDSALQQHREQ